VRLTEAEIQAILSGPGYVRCPIQGGRIPVSTCDARIRKALKAPVRMDGWSVCPSSFGFSRCLECSNNRKE
jgi:hypothetical protein